MVSDHGVPFNETWSTVVDHGPFRLGKVVFFRTFKPSRPIYVSTKGGCLPVILSGSFTSKIEIAYLPEIIVFAVG